MIHTKNIKKIKRIQSSTITRIMIENEISRQLKKCDHSSFTCNIYGDKVLCYTNINDFIDANSRVSRMLIVSKKMLSAINSSLDIAYNPVYELDSDQVVISYVIIKSKNQSAFKSLEMGIPRSKLLTVLN